jgi:hypothetical protein
MRLRPPSLLLLFAVGLSAPSLAAPSALPAPRGVSADIARENPPVMALKDVHAGQRGRGYTVFASARGPEPFDVEILGVMHGYLGPGEDLIIAKLSGAQIERTGVIAGMSGSPVYIDGKLVGAVGYRFGQFTKDPIAGITPIERMMTARTTPSPVAVAQPSSWGQAEPVATPLAMGNFSARVVDAFRDQLQRRGYVPVPMAAGGASSTSSSAERFYAGGPIAGVLVGGDASMAGIGTVTWVDGNRFLGFGHPFNGTGETDMPVANAEIITTVASDAGSWKMGQPLAVVGQLTDDRLHAIAGTMGPPPRRIPVEVKLDIAGPRRGVDALSTLHFDVARQAGDVPMFIALSLANALGSRVSAERGGTWDATITATVGPTDRAIRSKRAIAARTLRWPVRVTDDEGGLDIPLALQVLALLTDATQSEFADVELVDVSIDVRGRAVADAARLLSGRADVVVTATGRELVIHADVQRYQGATEAVVLRTPLSPSLAPGPASVVVASPDAAVRIEREGGLLSVPRSYDEQLNRMMKRPPPGSWSVYLVREQAVPRLAGTAMAGLPASLVDLTAGVGGSLGTTMTEQRAIPLPRSDGSAALVTTAVTMGDITIPIFIPVTAALDGQP